MEFPRPVKLAFSVLDTPLVLLVVRVLGMVYSLTNPLPPVNTLVMPSPVGNAYGWLGVGTLSYLAGRPVGEV